MNKSKKAKLEKHGWKVGSTSDFLGLTPEEEAYIELKTTLSQYLQEIRKNNNQTQNELALQLGTSQSRIAKMEKCDPSVSIDLLVKSLFALGASRKELVKAIT